MQTRTAARLALAACLLTSTACGTLSVKEEKQLGHQVQRQVREQFTLMRDRVVVNYVRGMGEDLVKAARPSPFEFRFYVVEDETLNAFAIPGGAIYIHTGLILRAKNAAELSGVIAHEIGHVTARHVAKFYKRGRNTGVVANILMFAIAILTGNPTLAQGGQFLTDMAATAYLAQYRREDEEEADALGVETLVRGGWDPNAMVTMFETLMEESSGAGIRVPQFLLSHPASSERIKATRALIASYGSLPPLRIDDGGRLEIIQKRIELIVGTDAGTVDEDGGDPQ
jgi:predicted Zn-dependent protease